MKNKEYRSRKNAWRQVTKDHPEFKGLTLPAEGRKISGRKHGTARYEDEEDINGAVKWIHIVVVGTFSIALIVVFVI